MARIIVGVFLVFGAVGTSDYETMIAYHGPQTPFWRLMLMAMVGIALIVWGATRSRMKHNRLSPMDDFASKHWPG